MAWHLSVASLRLLPHSKNNYPWSRGLSSIRLHALGTACASLRCVSCRPSVAPASVAPTHQTRSEVVEGAFRHQPTSLGDSLHQLAMRSLSPCRCSTSVAPTNQTQSVAARGLTSIRLQALGTACASLRCVVCRPSVAHVSGAPARGVICVSSTEGIRAQQSHCRADSNTISSGHVYTCLLSI